MKKIIIILLLSVLSGGTLRMFAVPANPNPVEKTLPDGTKISYYVKGDEWVHWNQSPDGYTLLYDSQQQLFYAEKDLEGNLRPSKYKYVDTGLRSSELMRFLEKTPKDLRYSESQIETLRQIQNISRSEIQKAPTPTPVLGEKKALCVLMGFKDRPFSKTREEFEMMMNQEGFSGSGAIGSVKDFYRENSYGQMDLTVTVVGPYTTINNLSYYASQYRWPSFAAEAARAADADVDYNDFAVDGQLETFHVIFAGYGDEAIGNGQQIWSHKSQLMQPIKLDDVNISVYSCSSELRGSRGSNITYIGVICHELCHVFGADDYYDTDGTGNGGEYLATGDWDLMAGGSWNDEGRTPSHISMLQKILYGWVKSVVLTSPATVTNMPNSTESPIAYTIRPLTGSKEMYILENRQKIGFNKNVPGEGLLIYHIHEAAADGKINNTRHPQQAYVVCASASTAIPTAVVSSYGNINSVGAPFASTAARNEFSGTSTPRMFRWEYGNGIAVEDKPLTQIKQAEHKVSFRFMGGNDNDTLQLQPVGNLQLSADYNNLILKWNLPLTNNYPDSYEIYRNNEKIGELPVGVRIFVDEDKEIGSYSYCVKAVYKDSISDEQCKTITLSTNQTVNNLNAQIEQDSIHLTWDAPESADKEYKYALYQDGILIQKNIENTYYTYQPESGGNFVFSIVAYSENSFSAKTDVAITFIKIIQQPYNAFICEGKPYTIQVKAEPDDLVYQWYYKGEPIENATNNECVITDSIGSYYVVIKDEKKTHEVQSDSIEISYATNPNLLVEILDIPDLINIDSSYLIRTNADNFPHDWLFSDEELVTITPGETPNSAYLNTSSKEGEGELSVDVTAYCWVFSKKQTLKVRNLTAIESVVSPKTFALYPNPVSDVLTVSVNGTDIAAIIVTDINGREIFVDRNADVSKSYKINTSSWSKGIYFVRLLGKDGIQTGKIVKN